MSSKKAANRGPLAMGDAPLSYAKSKYIKASNCNAIIREDRLHEHYRKKLRPNYS